MVEIKDREALEAWLHGKPIEVACPLALRASLRVFPLVQALDGRLTLTLAALRALYISWVAGSWPALKLSIVAGLAADAASRAARAVRPPEGDAALAAARVADSVRAMFASSRAGARAADAIDSARVAVRNAYPGSSAQAADISWRNLSADANFLESNNEPGSLLRQPLWSGPDIAGLSDDWRKLKHDMTADGDHWQVWIEWYERRYEGHILGWEINPEQHELFCSELAIETNTFWRRTPAEVNADIAARVEAARLPPSAIPAAPVHTKVQPPRPAAIEPVVENGQVTLPEGAVVTDIDSQSFSDVLQTLKRVLTRVSVGILAEGNIDQRPARAMAHIAGLIGDDVPTQADMFEIAHELDILARYRTRLVADEWPDFLLDQYDGVLATQQRVVRQMPRWREMIRIAESEHLTEAQVEAAPHAVAVAAEQLRGVARVDTIVVEELLELSQGQNAFADGLAIVQDQIETGGDLLALDALESLNNVLKLLGRFVVDPGAAVAVEMANAFGEEAKKSLVEFARDMGKAVGPGLRKLLKYSLVGSGVAGAGATAAHGLGPYLIATFPQQFGWLEILMKALGL